MSTTLPPRSRSGSRSGSRTGTRQLSESRVTRRGSVTAADTSVVPGDTKELIAPTNRLIALSELPEWYRASANPFVSGGYRAPGASFSASLLSAFEWHNETLNIHTHLWPGLAFLFMLFSRSREPYFTAGSASAQACITVGCAGAAVMGLASAFWHTVHIVDSRWHAAAWKADFMGIVAVNFSHQLLDSFLLFRVILARPEWFDVAVAVETVFAAACLMHIAFVAHAGRFWGIVYPALSSIPLTVPVAVLTFAPSALLAASCVNLSVLRGAALSSVACSALVFLAGGVFFKGKFPERFFNARGAFDNVSSHVWHHLLIVAAIVAALEAAPTLHLLETACV